MEIIRKINDVVQAIQPMQTVKAVSSSPHLQQQTNVRPSKFAAACSERSLAEERRTADRGCASR